MACRAARRMAMDDNDDRNDADRLRETGVMSIRLLLIEIASSYRNLHVVNKFQCIEQKAEAEAS